MASLTATMILLAYLLGSVCSAVLVCRLWRLPDPRSTGSGNPGATNVLRIGGKKPAIAVLLCDVMKGTIPVWGGYYLGLSPFALALIGAAACLGHIYPIFFQFDGGKGVATAFGAMAPIGWEMAAALLLTWIATAVTTRYASIAAVVTAILAPVYAFIFKSQYAGSVLLVCALIIWRHRTNLRRLSLGKEPKIGQKHSSKA